MASFSIATLKLALLLESISWALAAARRAMVGWWTDGTLGRDGNSLKSGRGGVRLPFGPLMRARLSNGEMRGCPLTLSAAPSSPTWGRCSGLCCADSSPSSGSRSGVPSVWFRAWAAWHCLALLCLEKRVLTCVLLTEAATKPTLKPAARRCVSTCWGLQSSRPWTTNPSREPSCVLAGWLKLSEEREERAAAAAAGRAGSGKGASPVACSTGEGWEQEGRWAAPGLSKLSGCTGAAAPSGGLLDSRPPPAAA